MGIFKISSYCSPIKFMFKYKNGILSGVERWWKQPIEIVGKGFQC